MTTMTEFAGKRLVVGITGGIAAYKSAELVRLLVKGEAQVDVVMTRSATEFVGAMTFEALSGRPVLTDLGQSTGALRAMAHISVTRGADAILVAPATADFLSKLAHGAADDLLSTLCLARDCPLLLAPAMNRQMWHQSPTRRNVQQLLADGIHMLGPDSGEQACGEVGEGRMWEPALIVEALAAFFQPKLMAGRRVLLTAGPTFEAIDPVRGLTNRSSGKMGFALARACAEAGAEVTLVAGPVSLPSPLSVLRVDVDSALDMRSAVLERIKGQDVFIGVAAVADFRPAQPMAHKIKKGDGVPVIELAPNPDILAEVASLPHAPFCVGFAAESRDLASYAESKRAAKKLKLVVGNLVQDGLGGDSNQVILFDANGAHTLPAGPKLTLARAIVAHISGLMQERT